ncbi:HAD hydrolase-like protein [Sphingopyxis sp. JAI128]|uniref:HAD hydrolase-like protein n=1 Tax=Sphingopyxis sp. JAI128 TaxID=2723066 RepID=UPI001619248D|nr:HAD hydrolase-like protein [Sphingopyxis sp. JAI128]MBB6424672.1 phosphoglycolate phosphatase [Sphingopyxis sp. JAI128]
MDGFPFATVGFDLDGTLLDTLGDLAAAVNHVLATIDRAPLSADAVRPLVGLGTTHLLEGALAATGGIPQDDVPRLLHELLAYYEAHIAVRSRPFPGLIAALDRLDTMGVRTAVVTNKLERLARQLLGELGLADRMATIIGGDTLGPGKAKPSPAPVRAMIERCGGGRAALIGDSIFDVEAARGAGATSVLVSFGFLHRPAAEHGADHIIDHFDELVPLLATL